MLEDLADQFQSKDTEDEDDLLDIDFGNNYVEVLDQNITVDELENASTRLKLASIMVKVQTH